MRITGKTKPLGTYPSNPWGLYERLQGALELMLKNKPARRPPSLCDAAYAQASVLPRLPLASQHSWPHCNPRTLRCPKGMMPMRGVYPTAWALTPKTKR